MQLWTRAPGTLCEGPGRALAPLRCSLALTVPQNILLAYDKHKDKTVEEAKVAFLKGICRWPTFGSAFFEVKVGVRSPAPSSLSVSLNTRQGRAWPPGLEGGGVHVSARVCPREVAPGLPRLGCDHCAYRTLPSKPRSLPTQTSSSSPSTGTGFCLSTPRPR